jgi:hypothetical protein
VVAVGACGTATVSAAGSPPSPDSVASRWGCRDMPKKKRRRKGRRSNRFGVLLAVALLFMSSAATVALWAEGVR